jgi:hypothetical protein
MHLPATHVPLGGTELLPQSMLSLQSAITGGGGKIGMPTGGCVGACAHGPHVPRLHALGAVQPKPVVPTNVVEFEPDTGAHNVDLAMHWPISSHAWHDVTPHAKPTFGLHTPRTHSEHGDGHAVLQQMRMPSLDVMHTPDAHSVAAVHRLLSFFNDCIAANTHEPVSSHVAPLGQPCCALSVKHTLPTLSAVVNGLFSTHVVARMQPIEPHDTSGAVADEKSLPHWLSRRHDAVSSQ